MNTSLEFLNECDICGNDIDSEFNLSGSTIGGKFFLCA